MPANLPQPPVFSTALPDNVLRDVRARCYYAAEHAPNATEAVRSSKRIVRGWYFDGYAEPRKACAEEEA